ncbi:dynein beta chain, ciliary [Scaptodrosophila lebanonensis]|uniref:Dynein beta chain, ciliary n=1 Tax=Drosophila lebanonensis TaxID=7225 RepID=A0A6J2T6Q7_DROLE|nr:dynein beta chain, ciliary [Scaptodrosophila lebanonensis]
MADEGEKKKEVVDNRPEFFWNYISKTMRLKQEKWTKMITTNEFKDIVMEFLKDPEKPRIIFTMNTGGLLYPMYNFPAKPRAKVVYFIRNKTPSELTEENMMKSLMYGDLLPNPLANLSVLCDDVFFPLLNNVKNQKGWTSVIVNDMKTESQEMRNGIAQMKGLVINRTIFPLPICIDEVMEAAPRIAAGDLVVVTPLMKHSLEFMVVKWLDSVEDLVNVKPAEKIYAKERFPLPEAVFSFWESRLENLENLADQLGDKRIKTIGFVLEKIHSVFEHSYRRIVELVLEALAEARDITKCLAALKKKIDKFEANDMDDNLPEIRPLMLTLGLVWGHSRYFHTLSNMSLFLKLFHNSVIECVMRTIEPDSIFQGDIDEAHKKIEMNIQHLEHYKKVYTECRNSLKKFKIGTTFNSQDWTWHPEKIFHRLDAFTERLHQLKELFNTGRDFIKLEKIIIGGLKGRQITSALEKILEEYNNNYREWTNIQYNPLDPDAENSNFESDRLKFQAKTDILERMIAFQFEKALEDSHDLLLGGQLLMRPIIKAHMDPFMHIIVDDFEEEIADVKVDFNEFKSIYVEKGMDELPTDDCFPKVSGAISFLKKLRYRISSMHTDTEMYEYPLFDNDHGHTVLENYHQMLQEIDGFTTEILEKWTVECLAGIQESMNLTLLAKDDKGVLSVNFSDTLKAALKDIKVIRLLGCEISPQLLDFFSLEEKLWQARIKLMRIAEWYNDINTRAHATEKALIAAEMTMIEEHMDPIVKHITWNQFSQKFIVIIFKMIKYLHDRLVAAQENLDAIRESINSWGKVPLFQRKDMNTQAMLRTEPRPVILQERSDQADITQRLIDLLMYINLKLFFDIPRRYTLPPGEAGEEEDQGDGIWPPILSLTTMTTVEKIKKKRQSGGEDEEFAEDEEEQSESEEETITPLHRYEVLKGVSDEERELFREYEKYVDTIIGACLLDAVITSTTYLRMEVDNRYENNSPIFQILMELQEPNVVYFLGIDPTAKTGFVFWIEGLIDNINEMTSLLYRVAQDPPEINEGEMERFTDELEDKPDLVRQRTDILNKVKMALQAIRVHGKGFMEYSYLWLWNKTNYLNEVKKYGRALTLAEREAETEQEGSSGLKILGTDEYPPLTIYKEQLDKFIELQEQIRKWDLYEDFFVFLRLNMEGFKKSVLNQVGQWISLFKMDLINRVKNSLKELQDFVDEANIVLKMELQKDDFEGLVKILSVLNQINEKQYLYDSMFEPLKEIVELLKQYNYEFDDNELTMLNELPDAWQKVKRQAASTKQLIAPIQSYQVDLIEKRIMLCDNMASTYRRKFLAKKFFNVPCRNVYELIDEADLEICALEERQKTLAESAVLFELQGPDPGKIELCRSDIKLVKIMWDFAITIESTINDWKKTPWKKIDIENMDQECKKFGRELRGLDKTMRTWEPFIFMEASLKNLMTSLRAVTELQNPAIRDRHWVELMQTTHVKFNMDDSTTLKDLLDLNLHEYEEEVKNIVDKSVKEMAMEKTLKDIAAVWAVMEFGTEIHERTGLKLLKASEEMIETLEEHQVQLQNMASSKYIGYFQHEVTSWQQKLSNADQIIGSWFEVQRKWQYLESIFIGSEDIRSQLPEDSKRFDYIDREFKALLAQMNADRNVVRSTNRSGSKLYEHLEQLLKMLMLCEKALNDYLETKRLAYPRFYFVSSADLLDILSNGNNPAMVARHLTKLYDSMGKLNLIAGTKQAAGMVAKELEEYVPFLDNCDCSGKVEVWLNRVTDKMRDTLRDQLKKSLSTYDHKPRHVWIFEWPAQPALVGTQIMWTTETNDAFAKVQQRYENALKDYNKKQVTQLNNLIMLLLGDLTAAERQKVMTVCTIDVHSRDVVSKIISAKVENATAFQWQSQLRHRWDNKIDDCFANICDAQFRYDYEYLGNTPRLVITPLTDRCYITLTQSLHLVMGGAPAGPAGTGKTETTKDLGRALGMMVYVFNCSEQMDYKSIGNIHKGLAQTGAWGCFDEFNRISVEVLSVVAVQVKCIQDAIKAKKTTFNFLGEIISLRPTVGVFITMNPGYAGRAELPENLKALYRPCAMVVPDFALISEIMLVAEGFQEARLLARKFITLYTLCKELLSKQDHYDWGLRAIKSVLVVAGALRRDDRQRPEDQVLMRALRDFNIPKIVTDDVPVFMGLIGDLFPALDVPRKRNPEFEAVIKRSAIDLKLQPEEGFILKIVQLEELFAVRHSVFIIGFAGTGKSEVWKTLNKTYQNQKRKPHYNDLNPKAVTNDELFGIVNPATREWKDGLFSILMRDQANLGGTGPKWIVLDGDIDPMWIESLNTVMDDNKVLTLASNERIALTKEMRLLFEIASLRTATPATVSRAGILYINPQDLGWTPFIQSWLGTRTNSSEVATLNVLFDKYVPQLLDAFKTRLKSITPISDIARLQMTCFLLDSMLTPQNVPNDCPKDWYEIYFVFSIVWGFGSTLFQDQIIDWRNEFSKWFLNEFKAVKFPSSGNIFAFYIDNETKKFLPWTNLVPEFELDPDLPLQSNLVNTSETTRLRFFMDTLIEADHPVMLIGPSGSGKTILMNAKLNALPTEKYAVTNVPFNFYTTSEMLQRILEKPLEKKAGRNFGPIGNKRMIYFVDDMNMPEVDKYFTVQPHTLIRQFMDYHHWYDRLKLTLKDIHKCNFVSCMNPSAGSFTIDPRLQRHFCSFAVNQPSADALFHILNSILSQHLAMPQHKFDKHVIKLCQPLVQAAITLHQKVASSFLPTAIKFHYNFNLRDIANIFTGILYANNETCPNINQMMRLWIHECNRVYGDKLVDYTDIGNFKKIVAEVVRKGIEGISDEIVYAQPHIYCHFAKGLTDIKYMPIPNWDRLKNLLEEAQDRYNDYVGAMNLVLFDDAMSHVCRISRIIESSRGYALLIGVGGSGKQSLTRLAAFISSLDVFQIQLTKDYSVNDLKANIALLYTKAGVKSTACCFLMTDSEVAREQFLVLVNDLLASGDIHELYPDDEIENVVNAVRNEVKQLGIMDSRENCWKYFIEKVRSLLKVVLCFSPVGATLRVRSRKFPALVNCTTIDWFHEWPQQALESVSLRFLSEISVLPKSLGPPVSKFMAYVHKTVNDISQVYLSNAKRYNYTTPKSFLELIALYSKLLHEKVKANMDRRTRLENGLIKLASCSKEVDALQDVLKVQEVELKIKNKDADDLIVVVSSENEKVSKERAFASKEEKNVRQIEEDVTAKAKLCEEDFRKAQPALIAAQEALNTLNKNNLTELKSFGSPPEAVVSVCAAVLVLFASKGKLPKDRSWKASRVLMGNVDKFLDNLVNYDKKHIHPDIIKALQPYIQDPEFNPEKIMSKSSAAAGLCSWVININRFYDVYLIVEPKERALADAEKELKDARDKLTALNQRLTELEEQLNVLQLEYDEALAKKQKCQDEADKTAFTIDIANRLIGGLATEKVRWTESVKNLQSGVIQLPGDILLISCFISYVGCFTRAYRTELQQKMWMPTFKSIQPPIPSTEGVDPFDMICDDAQIAEWNNQGLPSDRMSAENAAILVQSERYPLMIDPQLQGIKWVKTKYGAGLIVLRLAQRSYLDQVEKAVSNGSTLLIENIGESVDAVLNPLLGRMLIKKGTILKIGDREIDYNPKFRLILHTKLANPHYKPEMQAQTTLINFTVTRDGLEDQLLAEVVKVERPDLETMRSRLTQQQNHFKITLKFLEDDLLARLSSAGDNVLEDVTLVMNLEKTKKTADEIEVKVAEAKITAVQIDSAREAYRPASERASIIYFILNDLFKINPIYQFSLKAFTVVFNNAMLKATPSDKLKERVENLIDSITYCSYIYTSRGLFEQDKLIFLTQMCIQILVNAGEVEPSELDFLLRFPYMPNQTSNFPWMTHVGWGGIRALNNMVAFKGLEKDIEGSHKRWKKFVDSESPENEKFPGEWKGKSAIQRLCIMRCIRPDRMSYAMQTFIDEKLGSKYIDARSVEFGKTFEESSPETHMFFVLSPGVDPLKDVEKLGKVLGFSFDHENFHSVSLGQGQEIVAENAIATASQNGHWVILQNIHLVARWLPSLEKKMEASLRDVHPNYRLFLSAEPAGDPSMHILPQGILESAIKITNEPPTGMMANIHKALDNFSDETLEMCSKETEFKAILFSLCYFHAVVAERRKFGPQGWNRGYPFNVGDLTISVYVLFNYLEANTRVPWEDLRYLFGEIMYGGHITDDWDRRLCRTYLEEFMQPELIDGELEYCPGFPAPGILKYDGYHQYIDDNLPSESPALYGLHSNAEIGFLTTVSERLFRIVFELQPRMSSGSASGGGETVSQEDIIKGIIEDLLDKIPTPFNILELMGRVEDRNPYIIVAFQECERMNILMSELRRSLNELDLGLKGELTISSIMEDLMQSLYMDQVPESWTKLAYPSLLGLQSWFSDLMLRLRELEGWVADFRMPSSIWLAGFFNPQSLLTAIMQQTARKNEWPLDRMCLNCDVTKKFKEEITSPPREGAYVNGLFMEGARWDMKLGTITDAFNKELFPAMPVIFIKAVTQDKQDTKNIYDCPVYKIRLRGPTFVWTFNLRSKERASKWTLAGVCLLLQT